MLLLIGIKHGFIGKMPAPTGAIYWFGQVCSEREGRWKAETIFIFCDSPQSMYVGVFPVASFQHIDTVACVLENEKLV